MWEFLDDLFPMMERMAETAAKKVMRTKYLPKWTGGLGGESPVPPASTPAIDPAFNKVISLLNQLDGLRSPESRAAKPWEFKPRSLNEQLDDLQSPEWHALSQEEKTRRYEAKYGPKELESLIDRADPSDHEDVKKEYYRREKRKRLKALFATPKPPADRPQSAGWFNRILEGPRGGRRTQRGRLAAMGRMMQMGAGRLSAMGNFPGARLLAGGLARAGGALEMAGGMGAAGGVAAGAAPVLAVAAIPVAIAATVYALGKFTTEVKAAGESLLDETRARYANYSGKIATAGAMTDLSRMQMDQRTALSTEKDTVELANQMKMLRENMQPLEAMYEGLKLDVFTELATVATGLAVAAQLIVDQSVLWLAWWQGGQAGVDAAQMGLNINRQAQQNQAANIQAAPQRMFDGWRNAQLRPGQRPPLRPLP